MTLLTSESACDSISVHCLCALSGPYFAKKTNPGTIIAKAMNAIISGESWIRDESAGFCWAPGLILPLPHISAPLGAALGTAAARPPAAGTTNLPPQPGQVAVFPAHSSFTRSALPQA